MSGLSTMTLWYFTSQAIREQMDEYHKFEKGLSNNLARRWRQETTIMNKFHERLTELETENEKLKEEKENYRAKWDRLPGHVQDQINDLMN